MIRPGQFVVNSGQVTPRSWAARRNCCEAGSLPEGPAFPGIIWSMRLKTSVTLSADIVKKLDRATKQGESRSRAIERILREALAAEARRAADGRDLAVINDHADALNAEAEDVLTYQTDL